MRALVVIAILALVAVAGLLAFDRDAAPRGSAKTAPDRDDVAPPAPEAPRLPDIADRVRRGSTSPDIQRLLEKFVGECVRRGDDAVAELAELLRDHADVPIAELWRYADGRLERYPSLRAAYLAALVAIPGAESRDALLMILELTSSPDEARFIAAGLHGRGESGWTEAALDHAARDAEPRHLDTRRALVALAAEADASGTAAQVVARAPRGNTATDPKILAYALEALPLDGATTAVTQVLADANVTHKAKSRYLRSFADRPEPDAVTRLREVLPGANWDLELRLTVAYTAAGSAAFYRDAKEFQLERDAAIRARYHKRLDEVDLLVTTALRELPASDPRRASLRRMIEKHRKAIPR